jgi:hypothetical protein
MQTGARVAAVIVRTHEAVNERHGYFSPVDHDFRKEPSWPKLQVIGLPRLLQNPHPNRGFETCDPNFELKAETTVIGCRA